MEHSTSKLLRPVWGFTEDAKILSQFVDDRPLKADSAYIDGKAGNIEAAIDLTVRLVDDASIEAARVEFLGRVDYLLPIVAVEMQGNNALPLALAAHYSNELDIDVFVDVYQSNKAYHTGADPMERLLARVEFDGEIEAGKRYVLVDDVSTMGSTLADCAAYVALNGGIVVGAIVMTNSSRSGLFKALKKDIKLIEERHNETVRKLFSIAPCAFTHDEARYLSNFKTSDGIRGRAVKARYETESRLSAKKIPKS